MRLSFFASLQMSPPILIEVRPGPSHTLSAVTPNFSSIILHYLAMAIAVIIVTSNHLPGAASSCAVTLKSRAKCQSGPSQVKINIDS